MSSPDKDILSEAFHRERNVADAAAREAVRPARLLQSLALRIGLVLLLLAAVDLVARALVPVEVLLPYTPGEEAAYTVKVARLEIEPAPDLLVLGSSRVRDGVVPTILSEALGAAWGRPVRVFNLGLADAKAEEFLTLVRSHLPEPPPPLVVLGITGSELVQAHRFQYASRFLWHWEDAVDWMRRVPDGAFDWSHVESWLELELCRGWYLFAHRDAVRDYLLEAMDHAVLPGPEVAEVRARRAVRDQETRRLVLAPDGYAAPEEVGFRPTLERRLLIDPDGVRVPPRELEASPEMRSGGGFAELRAIAALLADRGCRLAVVEMPVSPYLQRLNPLLHGPLFRERLAGLAQELGFVWVPMVAEETLLLDSSYLDAAHLTPAGAQRYTRLLCQRLQASGFFDGAAR